MSLLDRNYVRSQSVCRERRSMRIPAEEPDEMDLGEAWNVLAERRLGR